MTRAALRYEAAVCSRPCAGQVVCGDRACWREVHGSVFVLMLDATGHGVPANGAAELAERAFRASELEGPERFLSTLHERLQGTVGAAAALARIELQTHRLTYAGVGNISGRLLGSGDARLVCRDGTLGQRYRTPRVQTLELSPKDLVVLHSDGISERFSNDSFPELHTGAPARVAAGLLEHYGKSHDDAGCAVVRLKA